MGGNVMSDSVQQVPVEFVHARRIARRARGVLFMTRVARELLASSLLVSLLLVGCAAEGIGPEGGGDDPSPPPTAEPPPPPAEPLDNALAEHDHHVAVAVGGALHKLDGIAFGHRQHIERETRRCPSFRIALAADARGAVTVFDPERDEAAIQWLCRGGG